MKANPDDWLLCIIIVSGEEVACPSIIDYWKTSQWLMMTGEAINRLMGMCYSYYYCDMKNDIDGLKRASVENVWSINGY